MSEGIGLREFGRQLGVSGEAVRKAIKTGRIPPLAVGEKRLKSGRAVPVIVDADAARAAFDQNTLPQYRKKDPEPQPEPPPPEEDYQEDAMPPAGGAADWSEPPPDGDAELGAEVPSIGQSRAITEAYKAKMAKLEYEEKTGKLVDAEVFRTEFVTKITTARNRVLAVPSKAKGRIPHLNVDDIEVIRGLLREALEDVANAC
jgi:hypothetical protein